MNTDIIFQKLISTVDGIGASTGKQTEKAFNENFELVKDLFTKVLTILSITVTSAELKQLKVDTSTTPYTLYYSLDDESVATPTWIPLLQFGFSQLTGSPMDNIALKTILDSKAGQGDLDQLVLRVNGLDTNSTTLQSEIDTLKAKDTSLDKEITDLKNKDKALDQKDAILAQDIKTNADNITSIKKTLTDQVVYTEVGSSLWIRYNTGDSTLEISTDQGTSWSPVGTLNIQWNQILGQPNTNTNLVNYITSTINKALTNYITTTAFNNHTKDYNNPHKVTASQLGLGSVLARIGALEAKSGVIYTANHKSFQSHASELLPATYLTSSTFDRAHIIYESEEYYSFTKTISSTETYTGPDGTVITTAKYEAGTSFPVFYKVIPNTSTAGSIDIYFNQDLYDYIQNGGVLD